MILTKFHKQTLTGTGQVSIKRIEETTFPRVDYKFYDIFIEPLQSLGGFFSEDDNIDAYAYNTYDAIINFISRAITGASSKECDKETLVDAYRSIANIWDSTDGGINLYSDIIKAYIIICFNNMNNYFKERCEKRWIITDDNYLYDNDYLYYDNFTSEDHSCAYYMFDKSDVQIFVYIADNSFFEKYEMEDTVSKEILLSELNRGKSDKND